MGSRFVSVPDLPNPPQINQGAATWGDKERKTKRRQTRRALVNLLENPLGFPHDECETHWLQALGKISVEALHSFQNKALRQGPDRFVITDHDEIRSRLYFLVELRDQAFTDGWEARYAVWKAAGQPANGNGVNIQINLPAIPIVTDAASHGGDAPDQRANVPDNQEANAADTAGPGTGAPSQQANVPDKQEANAADTASPGAGAPGQQANVLDNQKVDAAGTAGPVSGAQAHPPDNPIANAPQNPGHVHQIIGVQINPFTRSEPQQQEGWLRRKGRQTAPFKTCAYALVLSVMLVSIIITGYLYFRGWAGIYEPSNNAVKNTISFEAALPTRFNLSASNTSDHALNIIGAPLDLYDITSAFNGARNGLSKVPDYDRLTQSAQRSHDSFRSNILPGAALANATGDAFNIMAYTLHTRLPAVSTPLQNYIIASQSIEDASFEPSTQVFADYEAGPRAILINALSEQIPWLTDLSKQAATAGRNITTLGSHIDGMKPFLAAADLGGERFFNAGSATAVAISGNISKEAFTAALGAEYLNNRMRNASTATGSLFSTASLLEHNLIQLSKEIMELVTTPSSDTPTNTTPTIISVVRGLIRCGTAIVRFCLRTHTPTTYTNGNSNGKSPPQVRAIVEDLIDMLKEIFISDQAVADARSYSEERLHGKACWWNLKAMMGL